MEDLIKLAEDMIVTLYYSQISPLLFDEFKERFARCKAQYMRELDDNK